MHRFEIEYGVLLPDGTIDHMRAEYAAKNESEAIQDFKKDFEKLKQIHEGKMLSRPIINGHWTTDDPTLLRGRLFAGGCTPITDPERIKQKLDYFQWCDHGLIDMGDFVFSGWHEQLKVPISLEEFIHKNTLGQIWTNTRSKGLQSIT